MHRISILLAALVTTGCATKMVVTSQPAGAYLTEIGGGLAHVSPTTVSYDKNVLNTHKVNGCYVVRGWSAKWPSGATASVPTINLCGNHTLFNFVLKRPAEHPGLDVDLAHANQVMQLQQQRDYQKQQETAMYIQAFSNGIQEGQQQPQELNCTSFMMGGILTTNCK